MKYPTPRHLLEPRQERGAKEKTEGRFMKSLYVLAILWTLPWKGVALWKAARNYQKGWYVAMLVIQTLGILEIVYLLIFQKDRNPRYVRNV